MNTQPTALKLANAHKQAAVGAGYPELHLQTEAELRRLHDVERKYEMALQEGMEDCVERWGGYRSIQVTGSEYGRYLARMVAKFDGDVERVSRMKDLPTVADAEAKLGGNSYEIKVLRAAIAKAQQKPVDRAGLLAVGGIHAEVTWLTHRASDWPASPSCSCSSHGQSPTYFEE